METKRIVRSFSHAQSSADGLLPAAHRLDLLITEQRTLVKSTQDSLQQALTKYQRSNSKEEQESSRMQVQSLLTRAQELVMTVQVILHIRSEIGHVQQEIRSAKERNEPTSKLHGRLQWLEQHLEKILMAKRRGRPGVHVRRMQASNQIGGPRRTGGRRLPEPLKTETISIGTLSRGDNLSDFEGVSQQGTPWKSDSTETSNFRNTHHRSLPSSKHSASRDSDAWHSESEANWTMVEAYSNHPKDITQSQVLSDDEAKQSQFGYSPSWSKSREPSISPHHQTTGDEGKKGLHSPLPYERTVLVSGNEDRIASGLRASVYKFEPKRSTSVFGECSWNSLNLAVNSNLVRSAPGVGTELLDVSMSMLHAGVNDICKDVESLKRLIANAGQAATNPGPLVSANKTAVHFALNSREKISARRSLSPLKNYHERKSPLTDVESVSSPESITSECSKLSPSRKVYGMKVAHDRSSTYPRATGIWCETSPLQVDRLSKREALVDSGSIPSSALIRLQSAFKRRSRLSGTISRGNHLSGDDDLYERQKHQEKCINHLLAQTESPVVDVRKSSVQALGMLPYECEEIEKRLHKIMISDKVPLVQYNAFKSLLSLGILNDEVIAFASCCLRGSHELSVDVIQFLCQDHVLQHLSKKVDESSLSAIEKLYDDLAVTLRTGNLQVVFPAAVLLSQAGLEKDDCMKTLKKALGLPPPEQQIQALSCLIKCWQCSDDATISSALQQMRTLHNWKFRQRAVENLMMIGKEVLLLSVDETGQSIYDVLLKRLASEPILSVRISVGKLLAHLGLDSKAETVLMGKLESKNEVLRGEAITALSAFEIQSSKNIRALLECLEFDPSTYIRVQVVKLFSNMKHHNPTVINKLIEKSKGKGPVAMECLAALQRISKGLAQ